MELSQLARQLDDVGVDHPGLEALVLLELVSGLRREFIISEGVKLTPQQRLKLEELVQRRKHTPLAYLVGHKEFYGYSFFVNKAVLIPRPESEDIVETALQLDNAEVLDIGCGSGCLGIAYMLEKGFPHQQKPRLTLLDLSQEALKVARINGKLHKIPAQYIRWDISTKECPEWLPEKGLILANLPYLPDTKQSIYEQQSRDLKAEPGVALYASDGGLQLYSCLFRLCRDKNFTVITESLPEQHARMIQIAQTNGYRHSKTRGLAQLFRKK